MSNKLAKPHTNGHTPSGHKERVRPSFVSSAGYTLHYRYLSPETMPRLQAAARTALAADRPHIPTQKVEVGPGEWREVENAHDATYQEALEQWEAKVNEDQGRRFLTLCEQYALIYEIDAEEVAALRAVHAAIGDPLDDLTDAQLFLWRIALPTMDDQLTIHAKLFGGLTEEAIQAQKASFLSQLQGAAAPPSA